MTPGTLEPTTITSRDGKTLSRVMENTAIIHFCGKKPWEEGAASKFVVLYKHYATMAKRHEHPELPL